ncbi:MAG: VWA domain-containing protein [Streptosporangiales bacterium]|nr:VWA domain-containing protein [Streptosporangiales bacterium]
MSFLAPERLLLLLGVAALVGVYVFQQQRRSRYAVRFTNLHLLDRVAPEKPRWRRHVPAAAFLAMLCLLVTGFARPAADVRVPRERATIMVAVDVSPSMRAADVQPTRLDAAKTAAQEFVEQLPERFNVGLVAFSGSAAVAVPPTTDRQAVLDGIGNLRVGQRTAIGEAVFTSLQAISTFDRQAASDPPPARIVLLSDGANTAGRSPDDAAAEATQRNVPVSTIAYGTPNGMVRLGGELQPVPPDLPTLRDLATVTGGGFYEAASVEELREVYEDIGSSIGYRTERRDVSAWFVGLGLLAALAAAAGSLVWFSRLP